MSELLWVSVPSGRVRDGRPRLRVVIVPRLQEPLATVGMADWPKVVEKAKLSVEVVTGASIREIEHRLVGFGRPDAWHAVFDHVDVRPFVSRPAYEAPTVAPTSEHTGKLLKTYETSAQALSTPGPDADEVVANELATWNVPEGLTEPPPLRRPAGEPPDFHRVVALLRDHPTVLRALGLILDLELSSEPAAADAVLPQSSLANPAMIKVPPRPHRGQGVDPRHPRARGRNPVGSRHRRRRQRRRQTARRGSSAPLPPHARPTKRRHRIRVHRSALCRACPPG